MHKNLPKKRVRVRKQTAQEQKWSRALQAAMESHGFLILQLLLGQDQSIWTSLARGSAINRFCQQLMPVARKALRTYGLHQEHNVQDVAQQILLKMCEGRYFKTYRANQTVPKLFIHGCAPNYARTIARSIWRERCRLLRLEN